MLKKGKAKFEARAIKKDGSERTISTTNSTKRRIWTPSPNNNCVHVFLFVRHVIGKLGHTVLTRWSECPNPLTHRICYRNS